MSTSAARCRAAARIVAALHDAEQRAPVGAPRTRACSAPPSAATGACRARSRARRRQLHAFVELHRDVGAEQRLDLDRALGRELDRRAVEVRAEGHALVLDLAQLRQRHHLEAAGIGEDRPRPVHEPMQAAERRDALGAGPQHQVIGVGEHDVGAGLAHLVRCMPFTVAWVPTGMNGDRHQRQRLAGRKAACAAPRARSCRTGARRA